MVKVLLTIEDAELDEMKKLARVDTAAGAVLSVARLGAKVERERWMADEFERRQEAL